MLLLEGHRHHQGKRADPRQPELLTVEAFMVGPLANIILVTLLPDLFSLSSVGLSTKILPAIKLIPHVIFHQLRKRVHCTKPNSGVAYITFDDIDNRFKSLS